MSEKNKKNIVSEALQEMDAIKATIKEESKSTISQLLKEEVKNYMRDAIDNDSEEDEDDDVEIQDNDEVSTDVEDNDAEDSDAEGSEGEEDGSDDEEFSFDNDETEDDTETEDQEDSEEGSDEEQEIEDSEDGDEWAEFDQYKVDDDTYDLTGEKDYNQVVKVYKRLSDEDNVIVKKDGDKVSIEDKNNDTEYVIDLGTDDNSEDEESEEFEQMNENKKRKTMKENKEIVLEVDLGYTDNYQDKDPIEGLNNSEPSKNDTIDKGIPTDTKKPWAGDAKKQGAPFGAKTIEEGEVDPIMDENCDECGELEEGAARTSVKTNHKVKSATNGDNTQIGVKRHPNSKNGSLEESKKIMAMYESLLKKAEAVLKENKELRQAVLKVKGVLQEAQVVNMNLGKVTKLFMENTTSKNEKIDIINRFNEAKTVEQSNALYESISRELKKGAKQTLPLQEVSMTATGSKKINETKLYESQDLLEVRDLMKRMENC